MARTGKRDHALSLSLCRLGNEVPCQWERPKLLTVSPALSALAKIPALGGIESGDSCDEPQRLAPSWDGDANSGF
jgi:hypothetical protein